MTTNEYIRGVKQLGWTAFRGQLWQRNYHEHIIRTQESMDRIDDIFWKIQLTGRLTMRIRRQQF
jgi:hypothetical protein